MHVKNRIPESQNPYENEMIPFIGIAKAGCYREVRTVFCGHNFSHRKHALVLIVGPTKFMI